MPTVADATATMQVRINGGSYSSIVSGASSAPLALNVGANLIEVRVTAQDGATVKTYTLTVTRAPSSNANLSALALSAGSSRRHLTRLRRVTPRMWPTPSQHGTVTPTVADTTATVRGTGQRRQLNSSIVSGAASKAVRLVAQRSGRIPSMTRAESPRKTGGGTGVQYRVRQVPQCSQTYHFRHARRA